MALNPLVFKQPLTSLPLELVTEVASLVSRPDLARLLRVNSFFHKACVKLLYTRVDSVVIAKNGIDHYHPPLDNPTYAQHVRCLDAPVGPDVCCDKTSYPLPNLEVLSLSLTQHCSWIYRRPGQPGYLSNSGLDPRTIVLLSPFLVNTSRAAFSSLLDGKRLVAVLNSSDSANLLSRCIPSDIRSLTLVLHNFGDPDGLFGDLFTKALSLCHRFAVSDTTQKRPFPKLQQIRFVFGGVELPAQACEVLLSEVDKHMVCHAGVNDASYASSPKDPTAKALWPAIELQGLSEFLRDKKNAHIMSKEDVKSHYEALGASNVLGPEELRVIAARCSAHVGTWGGSVYGPYSPDYDYVPGYCETCHGTYSQYEAEFGLGDHHEW